MLRYIIMMLVVLGPTISQDIFELTTRLDDPRFRFLFHQFRNFVFNSIGQTGLKTTGSFLQEKFPDTKPFPCDVTLGRSRVRPHSIHKLRPGGNNLFWPDFFLLHALLWPCSMLHEVINAASMLCKRALCTNQLITHFFSLITLDFYYKHDPRNSILLVRDFQKNSIKTNVPQKVNYETPLFWREWRKPVSNRSTDIFKFSVFFVDISVIGALGDSLTCSTGAMATKFMELSMENRGVAWSIGGELEKYAHTDVTQNNLGKPRLKVSGTGGMPRRCPTFWKSTIRR